MMDLGDWIWMLVWIAALLAMVWLIVRHPHEPSPEEDAMEILRGRFARGELTEAEFEHACKVIRAERLEMKRWTR